MMRWVLPLGIVVAFVLVAVLAQVQGEASRSPLAGYTTAGGGISIPGGKLTKEMQRLLFPGPAPKNYTTWSEVVSPYPTAAVKGTVKPVETTKDAPPTPSQSLARLRSLIADGWARLWTGAAPDWRAMASAVLFDWWLGRASATCGSGGGVCYWIGGTGTWAQTAHWSSTSGGTTCSCVPLSTDGVQFDTFSGSPAPSSLAANTTIASLGMSGGGSGTVDTTTSNWALTVNGQVVIGASGLLNARGSTVTVWGNLDTSAGASGTCGTFNPPGFTCGTSTLVFAANASAKMSATAGPDLYNLTVNDGVTLTLLSHVGARNAVSVGGATGGTVSGSSYRLYLSGNTFTLGSGVTAIQTSFEWLPTSPVTLPPASYQALVLVTSSVITLGGDVTTTGQDLTSGRGIILEAPLDTSSSNRALTVNGGYGLYVTTGGGGSCYVAARSSAVSASGFVSIANAACYVTSSSPGSWTVAGNWTNLSTSASWAFAASLTFDAASSRTLTFCGSSCGGGTEFTGPFTLDQGAGGTGITYTMAGALSTGPSSVVTIQRSTGSGTVALTTSGTNYAITAGSVTMATNATLTANASSISVGGNWTQTGTFSAGTSTVTLTASATVSMSGSSNGFYNASVAAAGTTTTVPGGAFLFWSGALTLGTGSVLGGTLYNTGTNASPIVNGGATITSAVTFDRTANATIPVLTTTGTVRFTTHGWTATLGGAITVGALQVFGTNAPDLVTLDTSVSGYAIDVTGTSSASVLIGNTGNGSGALVARSSVVSTSGGVQIRNASYVSFGSSSWTVLGAWNNASTDDADWSAATGSVTLDPRASGSFTDYFSIGALGTVEVHDLILSVSTASYNNTVNLGTDLKVDSLSLISQAGYPGPGLLTFDVTNANFKVTATSITTTGTGNWNARGGTTVTTNWDVPMPFYSPSCFTSGSVPSCVGAAVVEFTGTGTIVTKNNISSLDFWNMKIDSGATISYAAGYVVVGSQLTVDGTLTYTSSPPFAIFYFRVRGYGSGGIPLVLGGSADMTSSGAFMVIFLGTDVTSWSFPSGTFQDLDIVGAAGTRADLSGDLTVLGCASPLTNCQMMFDSASSTTTFEFHTNGHALMAGGNLNIGDIYGLVFYFGSSVVTATMLSFYEKDMAYLETATITAHAATDAQNPRALDVDYGAVLYGGSATVYVHGTLTMAGAGTGAIHAGSSVWNLYSDEGTTRGGSPNYCPGCVNIAQAASYIDFGSSSWYVSGAWYNVSTSPAWSVGTSAVTFSGSGLMTLASVTGGIALPEFPALTVTGGYTVVGVLTFASLDASAGTLRFGTTVLGSSGVGLALAPSAGYGLLSNATSWDPTAMNLEFTAGISDHTGTLTITLNGLTPGQSGTLYKNGVAVDQNVTDSGGILLLVAPASWTVANILVNAITPTLDTNTWIFVFLLVALLVLFLLAHVLDSILPVFVAGVVLFLIAFQAWAVTGSLAATLALVAVGFLILAFTLDVVRTRR